jgi:glycosyltransferase involved in cell wall biosynthesis
VSDIWIFYPPLKRPTGGSAVLLQLARAIHAWGRLKGLVLWEKENPPFRDLPRLSVQECVIQSSDTLIVPEGWPNALNPGLKAGCTCIVYCQNWAYLFHGLPKDVRWSALPVRFWAVSDPVAWYLQKTLRLGKRPHVIRPALDHSVFHPQQKSPAGMVRVAYMPRKNKALAEQVQRIFTERNPQKRLQWVPVENETPAGVADILRSCHMFLATGFPEGFALPPLEAMACGCLCVGFTGFGGWDYMRQLENGGHAPGEYPLRRVSWEGNGLWFPDGDVLGAALGLERALDWLKEKKWACAAEKTVREYGFEAQKNRVISALNE